MARKIKFALEMADGRMVRRSLDELRENFDMEKTVGHFLSGKLVEWLEDRYYEEEAEKIKSIDKDAPDLNRQICLALGVECGDNSNLDVEQLERLNEKKAILREKTSDEEIISHASQTAFTQEDLADLLDMDESVIYLCGDSFNVPARVKNKKYIGILGQPKILTNIKSKKEADERNITFINIETPWENIPEPSESSVQSAETDAETRDPLKEELLELFEMCFGFQPKNLWYNENNSSTTDISEKKKKLLLKYLCNNELQENEFIYIHFKDDFSIAYGLSKNGIHITIPEYGREECYYEDLDTKCSYSNDIEDTITDMLKEITSGDYNDYIDFVMQEELYRFLNMAKNLCKQTPDSRPKVRSGFSVGIPMHFGM